MILKAGVSVIFLFVGKLVYCVMQLSMIRFVFQ